MDLFFVVFFFFQAEDGIRDYKVTGVQTCALPIWLRRRRRSADSRSPLRESIRVFDALGARCWADRARLELRATGEAIGPRTSRARDQLTPQELQIAQLAARGLSNRAIAERLSLSPRTIGGHLYRIFPKIGVS